MIPSSPHAKRLTNPRFRKEASEGASLSDRGVCLFLFYGELGNERSFVLCNLNRVLAQANIQSYEILGLHLESLL